VTRLNHHLFGLKTVCGSFVALAFGILLASAEGATTSSSAAVEGLYQKAKKEGEVIWQLASSRIEPVVKIFQKKYPDIKVRSFFKTSRDVVTQLIAEDRARDQVGTDVMSMDLQRGTPLLDRRIVVKEDWSGFGVEARLVWSDGFFVGGYDTVDGLFYNPTLVKASEVPKTWEDLLNPKWANYQIATTSSGSALTAVYYTRPQQEADLYFRKLANQKIAFEQNTAVMTKKFSQGEYKIVVGSLGRMEELQDKKIPVAIVPIGPVIAIRRGFVTARKSPHPNAARLLIVWLASKDGRRALKEIGNHAPAFPCEESELAELLCKNNLEVVFLGTREKAKDYEMFAKRVLEILRP
jgi:iron(III) transport system substrate-binding protein